MTRFTMDMGFVIMSCEILQQIKLHVWLPEGGSNIFVSNKSFIKPERIQKANTKGHRQK